MKFVWALFFVGAGNIQPIDTGYRFDTEKNCASSIFEIREQKLYVKIIDDNARFTQPNRDKYYYFEPLDREGFRKLPAGFVTEQYNCIPQKDR